MTVTHILVLGADPAVSATLACTDAETIATDPQLAFKDALKDAYQHAERKPPATVAFILPGDDDRVLGVASKLAGRGHPVLLHVTPARTGEPPATDLPWAPTAQLADAMSREFGVTPEIQVAAPAPPQGVDDVLDGYEDDFDDPTTVIVVEDVDLDDDDINLSAPPPPPGAAAPPPWATGPQPQQPPQPAAPRPPAQAPAAAAPQPVPAHPQPVRAPAPPQQPAPDRAPAAQTALNVPPQPPAAPPAWAPAPQGDLPPEQRQPVPPRPAYPPESQPPPPGPAPVYPQPAAAPYQPQPIGPAAATATIPQPGPTVHQTAAPAYKTTAIVHTFAVPKGGTGKTGLSALYASTLAEGLAKGIPEGAPTPRVVWVDGNPQQADGRYNIGETPERTIVELAATSFTEETIEAYLMPPNKETGRHCWVLAGPTQKVKADPTVINPALYRRVVETLSRRFDHVVIDTPEARLYDPQLAEFAIPVTDWLLVPVTPDRGILDNTKEWLDLIKAPRHVKGYDFDTNRVRIILNMARKDVGYGTDEIHVDMSKWAFAGPVPYSLAWARSKNDYCLPFTDGDLRLALRHIIFEVTGAQLFKDEPKRRGLLAGIGLGRRSA